MGGWMSPFYGWVGGKRSVTLFVEEVGAGLEGEVVGVAQDDLRPKFWVEKLWVWVGWVGGWVDFWVVARKLQTSYNHPPTHPPTHRTCSDGIPLMVPLVPTGINTGVATGPWGRCTVAARARPHRAWM